MRDHRITIEMPSQGADPYGMDDRLAADVIAAVAAASGVDPIVVRDGIYADLWCAGRRVSVGIEVALPDVEEYREHYKSITVDVSRYALDGAAKAVASLLTEGEPEEHVQVRREDLRVLLEFATRYADVRKSVAPSLVRRLRKTYAHALDEREGA
jgi:hypothetical protein